MVLLGKINCKLNTVTAKILFLTFQYCFLIMYIHSPLVTARLLYSKTEYYNKEVELSKT